MIWVDYCILLVGLVSLVVGVLRGFTKEIFSLLNWLMAFGLAWAFGSFVADGLAPYIGIPALRTVAGYALCFLMGLLIGALVSMLLVEAVRNSRLAPVDRTLGGGFGLLRGLLVAALFVMIADNMGARGERWWQRSAVIPKVEWIASGLQAMVPERWLQAMRPAPQDSEMPAEPPATPQEG